MVQIGFADLIRIRIALRFCSCIFHFQFSIFHLFFFPRFELAHIAPVHTDGRVDGGAPKVQGDFLKGQGRFGRGAVSLFYGLQL